MNQESTNKMPYISEWTWRTEFDEDEDEDEEMSAGFVIHEMKPEAYFKTVHAIGKGTPPNSGVELIGYLLATRLQLPIPEYFCGKLIDGTKGVGSYLIPEPRKCICEKDSSLTTEQFLQKFSDPTIFSGMLVFDVFTGNIDRHCKNVIIRELQDKPWEVYLIDHTHLFQHKSWLRNYLHSENVMIEKFMHKRNGVLGEIYPIVLKDAGLIKIYIERIEQLNDEDIHSIVDHIPEKFLKEKHAEAAKKILIQRRNSIREIFRSFL